MEEKVVLTSETVKQWFLIKAAVQRGPIALSNFLSTLTRTQNEILYSIVKHSLYVKDYVEIIRKHPELKVLVKTDEDRLIMHDIYEIVSWKLNKYEPPPKEELAAARIRHDL
ncbi:hypothetical protein HZC07_02350 [Candidatus Micrarchaeota archaeon]|nr:hypothetical protein [Candidatus Micrarchaeota archaeon]